MAAPGAILISKLMLPQTKVVDEAIEISDTSSGSNALDALANGTTEGLKLALNVGAMLLVFIAFIALINGVLNQLGTIGGLNDFLAPLWGYEKVSLEAILGTLFCTTDVYNWCS
jgi:Nucleoside permease